MLGVQGVPSGVLIYVYYWLLRFGPQGSKLSMWSYFGGLRFRVRV
jgi:hypothetical protein